MEGTTPQGTAPSTAANPAAPKTAPSAASNASALNTAASPAPPPATLPAQAAACTASSSPQRCWQLRNEDWHLPAGGGIMGIINATPDSFSDGGQHNSPESALAHARRLLEEGADILDIGGESTRPGAAPVSPDEELRRVLPLIRALHRLRSQYPALRLSIDTRHAEVAQAALDAGADIVNDISGLSCPAMRTVCAQYRCGVILMHMQGEPQHMQDNPQYSDVVAEVRAFFAERVALAEASGISPACICLDPGIGFGKTTAHNLALIRHLAELRVRDLPLMMALSRKRFLNNLLAAHRCFAAPLDRYRNRLHRLHRLQPTGRGPSQQSFAVLDARTSPIPTVAMSLVAAENGADLHRVHDVAPLRAALQLYHQAGRAD